MKNLDFAWLTDKFMFYCRSIQLREITMISYEQPLHLFGHWLAGEPKIYTVDEITDLEIHGKSSFSDIRLKVDTGFIDTNRNKFYNYITFGSLKI